MISIANIGTHKRAMPIIIKQVNMPSIPPKLRYRSVMNNKAAINTNTIKLAARIFPLRSYIND